MTNTALQGWGLWLALAGACLGTYVCRAIGVMLSGRINQDSEIFRWLAAITYAMVATLTVRLILFPVGMMASVPPWIRILICVLSIGVMVSKPTKRLVPALLTGTLLMVGYGIIR
ncbi:AzlD domain-containing protein [Polynucleobacter sp. AP-Latsch-80-C2]|jgi:branched-subunit amino acid transport protein|uniref:AzlD domain-containing protein n=1 Tax=Polynucleobacter sp. AP-Latsch-80-C2 TaxID=2576931 RepID=UPI001C0AB263|nr:AzlD domain-containing protein [Polynucleobacter sp. AP-Latsch-80-C2]MBU3622123.1 AzlD domain-containing protein [Polynucleobacter sp. AP-Latsch-80-C2]